MKIYLDTCSIHRPLDSKNQVRILLEADAVLGIIAMCDSGEMELVSSEALLYEARRDPNPVRKQHAFAVLDSNSQFEIRETMLGGTSSSSSDLIIKSRSACQSGKVW
jgi:hypothetical protein